MVKKENKHNSIWMMAVTAIIIFFIVGIVITGFHMLHKKEESRISSVSFGTKKKTEEDAETDKHTDAKEKVYLIKGNKKSSNRYERADHLSYTGRVKYTVDELGLLDGPGLKITRNEIYARHGRIFNDQELQDYFRRQKWYVPQTAANDFDESCLNDVEEYNVKLIQKYEQQEGMGS
ncbi:MAG: YARHG domain-containing protein [Eubacterium sp.]|nr:YARHG domain-containing protein [Eubacterium sp.]MDD7208927.1 YARHG domain-containing protein [Lachnospiraceae bacterium]